MDIKKLMQESHKTAIEKGWWEGGDRNFGELLALCHSEISECLEEYRKGYGYNQIYYEENKPCGIPIEMADLLIRVADMSEKLGIDLEQALEFKLRYNKNRPYRHGNKKA